MTKYELDNKEENGPMIKIRDTYQRIVEKNMEWLLYDSLGPRDIEDIQVPMTTK